MFGIISQQAIVVNHNQVGWTATLPPNAMPGDSIVPENWAATLEIRPDLRATPTAEASQPEFMVGQDILESPRVRFAKRLRRRQQCTEAVGADRLG